MTPSVFGAPMVDAMIGPYRVLEPIGRGGMGIVYRARHASSSHAVALKTVRVPSPQWFDSIRREVHALTRIRHPGVVRIIDHGIHQGRPWYAMDLLEGESLRNFGDRLWSRFGARRAIQGDRSLVSVTDIVDAGPHARGEAVPVAATTLAVGQRPPAAAGQLQTVARLLRSVCATLGFLHGEGFVNCDLKPENVLLVDANPVLIDFGLSAHHPGGSSRESLEALRAMWGTLPYMSPEQIRGEFMDGRSDLYALGCVFYELLTGAPPFSGSPRALATQHQSTDPVPPSQLVSDLPPAVEALVLRLLEKDVARRAAHADEVASELAQLCGDPQRLPGFPPSRPYLYRPRLVGRAAVLTDLTRLRERAAEGSGSMVLVGGESGIGKTRLVMELTRVLPAHRMRVITSELSNTSLDRPGAPGLPALEALRPLLQAIADRCQEAGPELADELLGEGRAVLARYEPLLLDVPSLEPLAPVLPLPPDAARQRLFRYLSDTLTRFAREQPVLFVIDDVGWADDLSIAFLASLGHLYFEATPLFVACTYRTEDASSELSALAALPHVTHVRLDRLDSRAVHTMVADMLALRDLPDDFLHYVTDQTEGNPFFVSEYLRSAVTESVLFRKENTWGLRDTAPDDATYHALLLPSSLRHLIEQRIMGLSAAARSVGRAAAALGRDVDLAVLREVVGVSGDDALLAAIDELMRRQMFEPSSGDSARFLHHKLREVFYATTPPEERLRLHEQAAAVLETRWREGSPSDRNWAVLAHHFAGAAIHEKAAHYFTLAADDARANHGNSQAGRLYREAIEQLELGAETSDARSFDERRGMLYEAMGSCLAVIARRKEARDAFETAMSLFDPRALTKRARLQRRIGRTFETEHQDSEAQCRYELALALLAAHEADEMQRSEWIEVQLDKLYNYYWLQKIDDMNAVVRELEPVLKAHGAPAQRARFAQGQMMRNLRRDRYTVSTETLRFAMDALSACRAGAPEELPTVQFGFGFALFLQRSTEEAEHELGLALKLATRAGDTALEARCLAYLGLAARARGADADVERHNRDCERAALASSTYEYLGVSRATGAWLATRRGEPEVALSLAQEALDLWQQHRPQFPFKRAALLPMMTAARALARPEVIVRGAAALVDPSQQELPAEAAAAALALSRAADPRTLADLEEDWSRLVAVLEPNESIPTGKDTWTISSSTYS